MKKFLTFAIICFFCSCNHTNSVQEKAAECAYQFAKAYFSMDLHGAKKLCTPESEKWIRFAASNVEQADLDVLNAQEETPTIEVEQVALQEDTLAEVRVHVENYLLMDTLGQPGHMAPEGIFTLKVVERSGQWVVRMEGLPQNEKRSRD